MPAKETINYNDLTKPQRAALLLIALGQEWATEVMRLMKEEDVRDISYWINQMKYVPQELTERVIREFYNRLNSKTSLASIGGRDYLLNVLTGLMGEEKATELVSEITTREDKDVFQVLKKIDPGQLAAYFKRERPQTVSLMMTYINPKYSAPIIAALPATFQTEVIMGMAKIEETDSSVVDSMERTLNDNLGSMVSARKLRKVAGVKLVAEVLNNMPVGFDKTILEQITEEDFDLATSIKDLMFVFSDIVLLDDKSVQVVIKDVDQDDLIVSLKGVDDEVKEKIMRNVSQRQAEAIEEELSFMGPIKSSVVQASQQKIVNLIRKLDEEGKILIQGKGSDSDEIIM